MKINDLIHTLEHSTGTLITFSRSKRIELPFKEIYPSVRAASAFLHSRGFDHHSSLAILASNSFEWVIADLASIWCGIKLLPIQNGEDGKLFTNSPLRLSAVLLDREHKNHQAVLESFGLTCIYIEDMLPYTGSVHPPHTYDPKEILHYKSTSGSTGAPKVMGTSVESVENSITEVQRLFQHALDDRLLVYLPLNLLQQRFWVYSAMLYGFTTIVIPAHYFFNALQQEHPTVIMGVPYIFELIRDEFTRHVSSESGGLARLSQQLQSPDWPSEVYPPLKEWLGGHIRYMWTGSAPISPEIIGFFFKLGVPLYQGYGMNETCIATKCSPGHNKIGSVGIAFPNTEVILDEQGQVLFKSQYPVCESYVICVEQDKQTFRHDGFIATGDIGYIDEDGFLFIKGRIKEMIALSDSKNVYPSDIEKELRAHEEIEQCILYGNGRPYLVALIIPSSADVTEAQIKDIISRHNETAKGQYQVYRFFMRLDNLTGAITNQNKVLRNKVYQKYAAEFEKLYE